MSATVLRPGFTTVQGLGRPGLGSLGIAPGGAMDPWSLRAANRLCGNPDDATGLEFTLAGPTIRFEVSTIAALCGSEFASTLDGTPVKKDAAFRIATGSTLEIGKAVGGARGYLAVAGDAGDASRTLRQGDRLGFRATDGPLRRYTKSEAAREVLRILDGPHADWSTDDLCDGDWVVSLKSDRVGVRLEGRVMRRRDGEIDPEPTVTGTVQLPPDGRPIVLGPDRGTTGGYPVVAAVIAADCGLLAHGRPGDTLRFTRVTIEDARHAWRERESALEEGITEWT